MVEGEGYLIIQKTLSRNENYSRKMERCITEISILTGMTFTDILDFLQFGATTEISELDETFDWNAFRRKIVSRLKGKGGYS